MLRQRKPAVCLPPRYISLSPSAPAQSKSYFLRPQAREVTRHLSCPSLLDGRGAGGPERGEGTGEAEGTSCARSLWGWGFAHTCLPACLPLPARLPACLPAFLLPACLPACLPVYGRWGFVEHLSVALGSCLGGPWRSLGFVLALRGTKQLLTRPSSQYTGARSHWPVRRNGPATYLPQSESDVF